MNTRNSKVNFDISKKVIKYQGNTVVDLKAVDSLTKARIFSKVHDDYQGYETALSINSLRRPFNFQHFALRPEGLIVAIVENGLAIEGMEVTENIQEAYNTIVTKTVS